MDKHPIFVIGPYRHQSNKALETFIHDLEAHRNKYINSDEAIAKARQILAERKAQGVIDTSGDDEIAF